MKVIVFQRPCGTLASSLRPRGAQPRIGVMLVEAQVSSMKTRRLGSSRPWYLRHCARRLATAGRSCSVANSFFFERDPRLAHDPPHRAIAGHDAALAQFGHQPAQRHVRHRLKPLQKPCPLRRKGSRLLASHRLRTGAASRPQPLRPLYRARHAHRTAAPCRGMSARLEPTAPPAPADHSNTLEPSCADLQRPAA